MKVFIRYLGYILLISAIFRIIPVIAGMIYHEPVIYFLIEVLVSVAIGGALLLIEKRIRGEDEPLDIAKAFMLVALSFIILPLVGCISFLPTFGYSVLDSAFESVSGFTTTSLTLYSSLDALPKSLLLWRAETQWMGGSGIILVFIFIISQIRQQAIPGKSRTLVQTANALYHSQGFSQQLEPGMKRTSKDIMIIYGGYTLLGIILLSLAGMPIFESIGMSFTSISTGGFTLSDTFYTNSWQLGVLCLLMLLGSVSFLDHHKLLQRRFKEFLLSPNNIFFIILLFGVLITLAVSFDFKTVAFQLISSFTTTGYSLTNISLLPHLFIMVIMISMVVGGSIASTSGGLKVSRIYPLVMAIPWFLKKMASPSHAVIPFKVGGKNLEEKDLLVLSIFVFSYILLLVGGTILLLLLGNNFLDSSFQITSALGTVGLQTMELASLHWAGKIILMAAMLLGRLEIFPVMILLRYILKIGK